MATFAEGLRDAARTGLCNYLGDVEKGRRYVNRLSVIPVSDFLRPLRNNLCDDPSPTDVPPFQGGQCPGVQYDVYALFTASDNDFPVPTRGALMGTLTGPIVSVDSTFTFRGTVGGLPNRYDYSITATNAGGATVGISGDNVGFSDGSIDVERVDGMPDNCGNPEQEEPEPFPDSGDSYPISFTYTNNEGDEINISGDVTLFAPVFAPVGVFAPTIIAPIRVNLPDLNFNGEISLAPEFNFNISPSGGDESPGIPTSPDGPVQPDTDEDTDDDEINEQLAGVFVRSQFTTQPQATRIFGGDTPDLFVPRIASVFFRVREGGRLGWLGPIDVKTTNTYIPVPTDVFAVRAQVFPEEGASVTLTPVRKRVVDDLT